MDAQTGRSGLRRAGHSSAGGIQLDRYKVSRNQLSRFFCKFLLRGRSSGTEGESPHLTSPLRCGNFDSRPVTSLRGAGRLFFAKLFVLQRVQKPKRQRIEVNSGAPRLLLAPLQSARYNHCHPPYRIAVHGTINRDNIGVPSAAQATGLAHDQ